MSVPNFFIFIMFIYNIAWVKSASNETRNEFPESFVNLTAGNDLWSHLLRDCTKPTFSCVRNSTNKYLQDTLGYNNNGDVQFTSFLKFSKNSFDYNQYRKNFVDLLSPDDVTLTDDETSAEDMSRSFSENAIHFFMTHDIEVTLPDMFFLGTTIRASPRTFEENGALVKLELIPKAVESSVGEGRIFFKKIRKIISQRLLYALLAILLVVKLLAVKILFVLPTIVGVATAKKLLLKVLLFLFPALHHLFKLCAYVPYGAKHHIHKHQISHIHEVSHGHHHHKPHGPVEYISPYAEGPKPSLHQHPDSYKEFYDPHDEPNSFYPGEPYFGEEIISNRYDLNQRENDVDPVGQGHATRRKPVNSGRPLTPTEIENLILKAEKEALIKARLQKEKQKIHQENLRLQEQLNKALKIQENLKYQTAAVLNSKLSHTLSPPRPNQSTAAIPHHNFISAITKPSGLQGKHPAESKIHQGEYSTRQHMQQTPQNIQKVFLEHDAPSFKHTNAKEQNMVNNIENGNFEQNIYKAASITYDTFYSPILENIDNILRNIDFVEEPCKERVICSMYKNPSKFSPYSNLLSVELSRDSKELQKPTTTNSAIIRFYRYVQAARDGQDKRDCLRLYPVCSINTEL